MSSWSAARLSWVASAIVPQRDKPEALDGPIPWVRIEDFDGKYLSSSRSGQGVTKEQVSAMPLRTFPEGTVVCSCSCTMGATAITTRPLITNQTFIGLVPDQDKITADFLYYYLQGIQEQLQARASGAIQQYLSRDEFLSLRLPLPPLDVQRRVADFLDDQVTRIDNIIQARQGQLARLDELWREEVRVHVAGGWVPNPSPVQDAPWIAPLNPQGEPRPLARLCTLQRGVDLSEEQRVAGPYPVVTTAGVVGTHDRYVQSGPCVVIGRYGTVGNVHWVDSDAWPHNTTLYVKDFLGNERRWVYYLLQTYPFEMLQSRSAVPGVNRNDMAGDRMPWIPIELQREAVARLDALSDQQSSVRTDLHQSLQIFQELKRSLITTAVSGEFDVSAADGAGVAV